MKKLFLFLAMAFFMVFASQGQNLQTKTVSLTTTESSSLESISWKSTTYDFGTIDQNKPVTAEFEFTNTGSKPVIILDVKASCGCTGTKFIKEPIQPGETSTIKATYNAKAVGNFTKSITVKTTATENPEILRIKGTVIGEGNLKN